MADHENPPSDERNVEPPEEASQNGQAQLASGALEEETWNITKKDIPVSSDVAIKVMDHAHTILQQRLSEATEELDVARFDTSLARFQNSEIVLGKRLASGNFADIFVVTALNPAPNPKACTDEQRDAAEYIKGMYKPSELVVKVLRASLLANPMLYATGAADVVTEGSILASVQHPHIVAIKGRSMASVEGFASGHRDSFFLVLERFRWNLQDQLYAWKKMSAEHRVVTMGIQSCREARAASLRERVRIMVELADAMCYLHEHRIIHRDLKLANIGLSEDGYFKLVDFGLSKILPPHTDENQLFLLTANTGSVRYMAPEIGRGEKYNLKADVFSFSILLYEVLNLEKAWSGTHPDEIRRKMHQLKQRPRVSLFWPASLRDLLSTAWSDHPPGRLSMKHVHTILLNELNSMPE